MEKQLNSQQQRAMKVILNLNQELINFSDEDFYDYLDWELREEFQIEKLSKGQKQKALWNILDKARHLFKLRNKKIIF